MVLASWIDYCGRNIINFNQEVKNHFYNFLIYIILYQTRNARDYKIKFCLRRAVKVLRKKSCLFVIASIGICAILGIGLLLVVIVTIDDFESGFSKDWGPVANPLLAQEIRLSETGYKALSKDQNIGGSNLRQITFAGYEWSVKSGYGGPGPNQWSDSEQSVWVDPNGRLHLKIREVNGTWYCAEVYTKEFALYGMQRFYVISRLDSLDKNVVAALFLYKDDQHEIDIEFTKWGEENPGYNAQYVVQPWYNPGNVERFLVELTGTYTTHYIDWHSSYIQFKSIHGHYQEPPYPWYLIREWLYTGNDIPSEGDNLRIHINLWLYQGNPPSDGQEVEIAIANANLLVTPIELVSFFAIAKENRVELRWATATETNNYGFEIQRSLDRISFTTIGFVKGNGTTSIPKSYQFVDRNVCFGTYYYRLKQVDTDGSFEYSNVVKVIIGLPNTYQLEQNYPNPFNLETKIEYQIPKSSKVTIKIFNILGEEVATLVDEKKEAGFYTAYWDGKNKNGQEVTSGVYIYRIQARDFIQARKIALIK